MADGAPLPIRDCARARGARFAIASSTKLRVTRDPNMEASAKLMDGVMVRWCGVIDDGWG